MDGGKSDRSPNTPREWKKWKAESKAVKRKWKEEKLIQKLESDMKDQEAKQESKSEEIEPAPQLGRAYTLSIAIPGSILDNAQTPELRTYLAGQIARAAVVFNVDEVIIFDESGTKSSSTEGDYQGVGKKGNCNVQMARVLQYLECPQYLRKAFFPQHKDLQYAGLLNPLDSPHHMRADEECRYREGVVLNKPVKGGRGSFVNVGLIKEVQIDRHLQPGVRVTVEMPKSQGTSRLKGQVVPPSSPRRQAGLYWGYSVRLASSLSEVFTQSQYEDGYDVLVGTSERGMNIDDFRLQQNFSHLVVVFGGVNGLEAGLEADADLNVDDPELLFHHYLNTCPNQGSKTIRTEEAILITLSALRPKLQEASRPLSQH